MWMGNLVRVYKCRLVSINFCFFFFEFESEVVLGINSGSLLLLLWMGGPSRHVLVPVDLLGPVKASQWTNLWPYEFILISLIKNFSCYYSLL